MRVIGIDPGYDRCGVAVLECTDRYDVSILFSTCITPPKGLAHAERLSVLDEEMQKILAKHTPSICAIETLFFSKNKKTALGVAEARGVLMSRAAQMGLSVAEYDPSAVKIAVTGYGRSTKKELMAMLPKLITLPHTPKHDDEYDAIAVALTYCVSQ